MIIRSLLLQDTKSWWWHKQLRQQGKIEEARRAEHKSLQDKVSILRQCLANGGWVSIGRGGWTCHYKPNAKYQGYGNFDNVSFLRAALLLGIPIIDSTVVPDNKIIETICFPMAAFPEQCDEPPYHSMSYAPLDYVVECYRALGAAIYNWERED